MQTQIAECITHATVIAVALASAKRQPPREATVALDRLLAKLNELVVIPDLADEPVIHPDAYAIDDLEELDPEPEEIAAAAQFDQVDPEAEALRAQLAAVEAQIAKATEPRRPVLAPSACRPEPAQTKHRQVVRPVKQREPRLPTVPEVAAMLERVLLLRPDAKTRGKNAKPVTMLDMAKTWLTEERRYRKQLRDRTIFDPSAWDLLAQRTPEALLGVQVGQDPSWMEPQRRAWELEEQRQGREDEAAKAMEDMRKNLNPVDAYKPGWECSPSSYGKFSRMVLTAQLAEDGGCLGCGKRKGVAHYRSCSLMWVDQEAQTK